MRRTSPRTHVGSCHEPSNPWLGLLGGSRGTFTDVVARRPDGSLVSHKLLSEDLRRYDDAATTAIADLLDVPRNEPLPPERIRSVKMGTTVATNALLQRRGVPTLLVTTAGFGDVLRIGY